MKRTTSRECYGTGADGSHDTGRVSNLIAFLQWHYVRNSAGTMPAQDILANNGFHILPEAWGANISNEYVTGVALDWASDTPYAPGSGCTGVTGGAN